MSLGIVNKSSLNTAQHGFGDSLNELGFTRGKNGAIDINSLLKSPKALEDDGIEDLHFHAVRFNLHRA